MQRIVDAVSNAAIVAAAVAIVFAFGIVAAALKDWRRAHGSLPHNGD